MKRAKNPLKNVKYLFHLKVDKHTHIHTYIHTLLNTDLMLRGGRIDTLTAQHANSEWRGFIKYSNYM
jgi:hypothetical protein